jgi:hypothetical protein
MGPDAAFTFPAGYGQTRLVLMVKDPWWLYAYWELEAQTERTTRSRLQPEEVAGLLTVLRVHEVTGGREPTASTSIRDVPLSVLTRSWYLPVNAPDREFIVELGLLTAGGRFLSMARSNRVRTPRAAPSPATDPQWAVSDEAFEALLRQTTGGRAGTSPAGWTTSFMRHAGAGSWLAAAPPPPSGNPLWIHLDADLVLHGRTDPRTQVRVDGQPVAVRRDGTFSVRLNVPEGSHQFTIEVATPDGRLARTVTPVIARTGLGPSGAAARERR